jgi:iduronate 2-sulfatase
MPVPLWLRILVFAVLLPASFFAAGVARPNVLFIMADDYRPELAAYGSPALTPNLDRLARRAVRFDRAYCQQAVCNPSRSSMLTGLRPDTLGLWNNGTHFRELRPNAVTLPQHFKANGYVTRCVGKIFHNWHTKEKGDARSWSAPEFLHYASHGHDAPQVAGPLPPNLASGGGRLYTDVPLTECRDVPDEAYYDGRVAAEAVRVLGAINDQPFFLAVGFWKPHAPFNAPKRYWDLYDRARLPALDPRRPAGAPEIAFHDSREVLGLPGPGRIAPTPELVAEMRHGYFANISYLDAQLGKVLDALDRGGRASDTIVVFVGDHGYHLGEHGLWGKTSTFELDARVPLLFAAPGVGAAGRETAALAELIDLFPTLSDLCGLPKVPGLEGTSLVPVLRDPTHPVKPAAYTQHPRPSYYDREPEKVPRAMGYSVRTAAVRYTEWRDWRTGATIARELYEEADAPAEIRSLPDEARLAGAQAEAERLLSGLFPRTARPAAKTTP